MSAHFIPVEPFDLVVFGGTGDLAMRKILPGLYHRDGDGQLPPASRIIAVARSDMSRNKFFDRAESSLRQFVAAPDLDAQRLRAFLKRIDYLRLDAAGDVGWADLAARLGSGRDRVRVFYLATSPYLFGPICRQLDAEGMITPASRVVLEKPLGHDLASAEAINDAVGSVFEEAQIFRIDHYLGKETVQNLIALRFANVLFEPIWNSSSIDHVQITVAEDIGVGSRTAYYDRAGALRDMVQNHLLQLLCLVAMEPPTRLESDAVRDEKLKVLRALKPIVNGDVNVKTVRGQYRAGAIDGQAVPGYPSELGADAVSATETFVVVKAEVENWRWAGVPFYLRTGKRMASRQSDIVIQFKGVPHSIFGDAGGPLVPNRLVVRLQPDEGVKLFLTLKDPGPGGLRLRNMPLNLSFAEAFTLRYPDAYERLLMDVIRGNPTLFMRKDEVEAAWRWVDPIIAAWRDRGLPPKPYPAGSWGPSDATALIVRDGRGWFEDAA